MIRLDVAASTFPFLCSHDGLDALKHLSSLGYDKFEMMIFPPHLLAEGTVRRQAEGAQVLAQR
ncbi:MAG: hypothetical protein OXJ64_05540 [Boseongicola sp.]|nr:hypothetical protein [Boseongicola sp.]